VVLSDFSGIEAPLVIGSFRSGCDAGGLGSGGLGSGGLGVSGVVG
jgi:hypothetical protein